MSPTPAEPADQDAFRRPPSFLPDNAAPADQGMGMCWAGNIALEDVLAAADRVRRTRAGEDQPAWTEPGQRANGTSRPLAESRVAAGRPVRDKPAENPSARNGLAENQPAGDSLAGSKPAGTRPIGDSPAGDPLAEDELRAAEMGATEVMSAGEMAGQVRIPPGPALASWLGQAQPRALDEAGLVNSVTGWRKITSWAQAQELAAVAEIARRRGVMDDPEVERDPARELEADFAPNEIALALTLTQCAAECWMSLAVSMARRLPETWSALSQGTIDLGRARLIDSWTTPLDDELAQAVERKVLVRAGQQTTGQLRASLQRAVISVDPAAAERRRAEAEKNARVELAGEDSGTATLSGHFLPPAQASAAWARISAMARAMAENGAGGGIDLLRAQVFVSLLLGNPPQPPPRGGPGPDNPDQSDPPPDGTDDSPMDDTPAGGATGGHPVGDVPGEDKPDRNDPGNDRPGHHRPGHDRPGHDKPGHDRPGSDRSGDDEASDDEGSDDDPDGKPGPGTPGRRPWRWPPLLAPGEIPWPGSLTGEGMSSRSALSVPWRTLAGWCDEPGQLTRMGAITAGVARELAAAAATDASCEWQIIVTDTGGQVITVSRIRSPGRPRGDSGHPPRPGVLGRITITVASAVLAEPSLADGLAGSTLNAALLGIVNAARTAVREASHVTGGCAHEAAVPGYRIPDRLRTLIEARDQDCGFPICRRPAAQCDLDHTVPYDQGGLTCTCNVSAECRRHHRMKGLTRWRLCQPRPGTLSWTGPSGLTWTVTPEPHAA